LQLAHLELTDRGEPGKLLALLRRTSTERGRMVIRSKI
jgi:hypothetical protein